MNSFQAADALRLLDTLPPGEPPLATLARAIVDGNNNVVIDGANLATIGAATVALTGAIAVNDTTTPSVTLATGKTNTGFFWVKGKTSGGTKYTTADATGQTVIVSTLAQTVGGVTLSIPDFASVADTFVFTTLAQSLASKTLVSPVISTGLTASGSAANTFAGSTGTFITSSGANTLSGAVTLAANVGITPAAGTGAFDLSLATGAMKTPTSSTNLFTFGQKTAAGAATNLLAAATGTAIPVTANGSLAITQNGAETNTLAIPTFLGQVLDLFVDTDTSGARVITSAQRINQAGNTIITLTEVGDYIRLVAITIGGALRWQVASNDGAALS